MKAFHNDEAVKKKYINRVLAHQKADEIIKGKYWESGKGCAVGCTIHASNHNDYEKELGIPEWVARLEDTLFEGMSDHRAKEWPVKFLQNIPVGFDKWDEVKKEFTIFILEQCLVSMDSCEFDHDKNPEVVKAIEESKLAVQNMIECHKNNGDFAAARSAAWSAASAAESAASAAESAARSAASAAASAAWSAASAAASAAESAARSAESAASAAWSAAWSAASAARSAASAAWSAASAAASAARSAARSAASAAESAAFEKYADKFLNLIKSKHPDMFKEEV